MEYKIWWLEMLTENEERIKNNRIKVESIWNDSIAQLQIYKTEYDHGI